MSHNIITIGNQVMILFILIGMGGICKKAQFFSDKSIKELSNFVLYIVNPAAIISSYCREFDITMLKGLLLAALAACASFGINILCAHLLVHDSDKRRECVLRGGSVFSNSGFMALPLQNAILGSDGVFYGATFVAVNSIIFWTYGMCLMSRTKKLSLKNVIMNPGILATIIGIIVFVIPFELPMVIVEPIDYLAALNMPIPMMIIGYRLSVTVLQLKGNNVWISLVTRLIVTPLILLGVLYLVGIRGDIMVATMIAASAPVAASVTMFAEKFDADVGLASALVSVSTLFSILTMPILIGLAMSVAVVSCTPKEVTPSEILNATDSFTVTTQLVGEIPRIDGFRIMQGGCVTEDYAWFAMLNEENAGVYSLTESYILKYDRETMKEVCRSEVLRLGHANDIAYVPDTNELYVIHVDNKIVSVLDADSLEVKEQKKMDIAEGYGIDYIESTDSFVTAYGQGG